MVSKNIGNYFSESNFLILFLALKTRLKMDTKMDTKWTHMLSKLMEF